MVRCPTRFELERYVEGLSTDDESRRIETHRGDCADCASWLQGASTDEELFGDVRRVLREKPLAPDAFATPPSSLARYRILTRLGAGGMGVVYEAEQKNPRRRVALKLLKPGFATPRALARFEHEAQILARLDHPGIASILEADTVEVHGETQPFFAMELVEGRPLDEFAREIELPARLQLFVKICEAVQHAHQKGVVHRDLKPKNILVTTDGQPRVLDFGVARTFDDQEGLRSHAGEVLGTLPYMSPEQVAGRPDEIDTRTDVYALGVVLYELCAGRPPFSLHDASIPEAARIIAEQAPPPLGTGDLATIAAKALAKEKDRRYPSAAALADDVRRFLENRPIEARPASAFYQFRKYTRRNPAVVTGYGLAIVALVAGVAATSVQAGRARAAESLAKKNAQDALAEAAAEQAANQFLFELLGSEGAARPQDYTVLEALERAERRIEARQIENPKVEATIRVALGSTQGRLHRFDEAEANLRAAIELRSRAYGETHERTAGAQNALAVTYVDAGRLDEGKELFRQVLDAYRAGGKGESSEAGTTLINLAFVQQKLGDLAQAEELLVQSIAILRKTAAEYPQHLALGLTILSSVLAQQNRFDEAEASLRDALAIFDQDQLRGSLGEAEIRMELADFLASQTRIDEAIELYREALDLRVEGRMSRTDRNFVRNVKRLADLFDELDLPEEARAVRAELRD